MNSTSRALLLLASFVGLLLVLLAPLLFAGGLVSLELQKHLLLAGTLLWFATAPTWMKSS